MLAPIELLKIGVENLQTELDNSEANNYQYRNDLKIMIEQYNKAIKAVYNS